MNMNTAISLRDYHGLAMRTSPRDGHDKIDNGMLGLIGETGELVDILKKWKYQSKPGTELPRTAIINELGDVLWYLEELADGMNSSMAQIADTTFEDLDILTMGIRRPSVENAILNLSGHAYKIRKIIQQKKRKAQTVEMKKTLHCAAYLARMLCIPIGEVARRNIEKLSKRYPRGFDPEISMARSAKEYGG